MGAGASAQFGPALDACAARPADGSDLRDFNTAKAEAVQLRRTLAARDRPARSATLILLTYTGNLEPPSGRGTLEPPR